MDLFLSQIGYLLAILLGVIGRRAKVFTKDSLSGLRFIVIYFLFPLSFYSVLQKGNLKQMGPGFLFTLALVLLSVFLLWILQFNKSEILEYLPALVLSNGLLLGVFFLDPHLGISIRDSFVAFSFSNLSFIYIYILIKDRKSTKRILFHIIMILLIGGFFFMAPKLPGIFQRLFQKIAGERGSFFYLLYLMIGIKLPEIKLKELFKLNDFFVIALSLLIIPVFVTILTRLLPINFFTKTFIIISSLMPASPMIILFEEVNETHLLKVFIGTHILGIFTVNYLLPLLV